MKINLINHFTKLIRREVGFFNGWGVDEECEQEACQKAAEKIVKYLKSKEIIKRDN